MAIIISSMDETNFYLATHALMSQAGLTLEQIDKLRSPNLTQALQMFSQCSSDQVCAYNQRYFQWLYQQHPSSTSIYTSRNIQNRHLSNSASIPSRPTSDCFSQSPGPSRSSTGTWSSHNSDSRQASGSTYDNNGLWLSSLQEGHSWLDSEEQSGIRASTMNSYYPSQVEDTFTKFDNDPTTFTFPPSLHATNMNPVTVFPTAPVPSATLHSTFIVQDCVMSPSSIPATLPTPIAPIMQLPTNVPSQNKDLTVKATKATLASEDKEKFFCPVPQCTRTFCGRYELKNHIKVHEKCERFTCKHTTWCDETFKKEQDWKVHHTKSHHGCLAQSWTDCRLHEELPRKPHWGCGFCEKNLSNLDEWLDHFINHIIYDGKRKGDFDFSIFMRSLLLHPAIKPHWLTYLKAMRYTHGNERLQMQWSETDEQVHALLRDLEQGVFRQGPLLDAGKAEEVVQYAVSLGQLACLTTHADMQHQSSQAF